MKVGVAYLGHIAKALIVRPFRHAASNPHWLNVRERLVKGHPAKTSIKISKSTDRLSQVTLIFQCDSGFHHSD